MEQQPARVLGVIPARFGSTRFPAKVLAPLGGRPMIQWVHAAALACREIDTVVVATDDERVHDAVRGFGGQAIMTASDHATGTDRLVEVARALPDFNLVVNIQGDEPGIEPDLIDGVVRLKRERPEYAVTTAARPFHIDEDPRDANRVKVVLSRGGRALYFSRSLIPFPRNPPGPPVYLHLGIYAYHREFLLGFPGLPASPLERAESLEQLRVLENDAAIGVFLVPDSLPGVDTPADLERMARLLTERGRIATSRS